MLNLYIIVGSREAKARCSLQSTPAGVVESTYQSLQIDFHVSSRRDRFTTETRRGRDFLKPAVHSPPKHVFASEKRKGSVIVPPSLKYEALNQSFSLVHCFTASTS